VAQVTGAQPPDHPDRDIAARLCGAGLVTFTIDYRFGGRVDPGRVRGGDEAAVLAQLYQVAGRSLLGELAAGASAALAWLGSHPAVEPGQVALFGHSLGGAVALHAALAQPVPPPLCPGDRVLTRRPIHSRDGQLSYLAPTLIRLASPAAEPAWGDPALLGFEAPFPLATITRVTAAQAAALTGAADMVHRLGVAGLAGGSP
jgi:dienelactone hydrolase